MELSSIFGRIIFQFLSFHSLRLCPKSSHLNPDRLAAPVRLNPHLVDSNRAVRSRIDHLPIDAVQGFNQAVRILDIDTVNHSIVLPGLRAVVVLADELGGIEAHVWVRGLAEAGEEGVEDVGGVGGECSEFEAWC